MFKDAIESKKQAANLPSPPFPKAGSTSASIKSSKLIPNSDKPSLTSSSIFKFNKLDFNCLPIKNSKLK